MSGINGHPQMADVRLDGFRLITPERHNAKTLGPLAKSLIFLIPKHYLSIIPTRVDSDIHTYLHNIHPHVLAWQSGRHHMKKCLLDLLHSRGGTGPGSLCHE